MIPTPQKSPSQSNTTLFLIHYTSHNHSHHKTTHPLSPNSITQYSKLKHLLYLTPLPTVISPRTTYLHFSFQSHPLYTSFLIVNSQTIPTITKQLNYTPCPYFSYPNQPTTSLHCNSKNLPQPPLQSTYLLTFKTPNTPIHPIQTPPITHVPISTSLLLIPSHIPH